MAPTKRKQRLPRSSLSRDVILTAAEAIVLRDGLGGLTFQAIGQELDAHPTSVYRHFNDKDELVLELIDSLRTRSYGSEMVPTDDWRNDLRHAAHLVHEHFMRYPTLAQQMATLTTRRPQEFANVDFIIGALRRAGLDNTTTAQCARAFGNMTRAMCAMEASMLNLSPEALVADETAWRVEVRRFDPEAYPNIAAIGDEILGLADPRIFSFAVERMIDGIAALADAQQAERTKTTKPQRAGRAKAGSR